METAFEFARLEQTLEERRQRVEAALRRLVTGGQAPAVDANACIGWEKRSVPADSAIADCDRLISSGKLKGAGLAKAFNERGLAWRRKGDLDLAIADYGEAIRHDPKLGDAYNNRGVAWIRKGDNERAIADLDNALRLAHDRTIKARAYQNRGSAHHATEQVEESHGVLPLNGGGRRRGDRRPRHCREARAAPG